MQLPQINSDLILKIAVLIAAVIINCKIIGCAQDVARYSHIREINRCQECDLEPRPCRSHR